MEFQTNYAEITEEQVCQAAIDPAQKSNMLYNCLCKSISADIHSKVNANKAC
jgi:hypothetical protein